MDGSYGAEVDKIHDRYKARLEEGFYHILIVDGVPVRVIDKSKLEKLLAIIAEKFTRKCAAIKPGDILAP